MITFKQQLKTNLEKVSDLELATSTEFYNPDSEAYTLYTGSLSGIYGSITDEQTKVAKYFKRIIAAGQTLTDQINGS